MGLFKGCFWISPFAGFEEIQRHNDAVGIRDAINRANEDANFRNSRARWDAMQRDFEATSNANTIAHAIYDATTPNPLTRKDTGLSVVVTLFMALGAGAVAFLAYFYPRLFPGYVSGGLIALAFIVVTWRLVKNEM